MPEADEGLLPAASEDTLTPPRVSDIENELLAMIKSKLMLRRRFEELTSVSQISAPAANPAFTRIGTGKEMKALASSLSDTDDNRARCTGQIAGKNSDNPVLREFNEINTRLSLWDRSSATNRIINMGLTSMPHPHSLIYGRALPTLILQENDFVLILARTHSDAACGLISEAPWLLRLTSRFVRLAAELSQPWPLAPSMQARPDTALQLLSLGLCDREAAGVLGVSERTIGRYVSVAFAELGAESRFQAGVLWERQRRARLHDLESLARDQMPTTTGSTSKV